MVFGGAEQYYNKVREIFPRFIPSFEGRTSDSELYVLRDLSTNSSEDPKYILISDEELVEFSIMGFIRKISRLEGDKLKTNLHRDMQNKFQISDNSFFEPNKLASVINQIYETVRTIEPTSYRPVFLEKFKDKWGEEIIKYFESLRNLVGENQIYPDADDDMLPVIIQEGCINHCLDCPQGGTFRALTEEEILTGIERIKPMIDYVGKYDKKNWVDEIFLIGSDIGWNEPHLAKEYGLKIPENTIRPAEIIELVTKELDHIYDVRTWFTVENTLRMCNTGTKEKPEYSEQYLKNLFPKENAPRITGYFGIETAYQPWLEELGKNDTYEEQKKALLLARKAGIVVKAIIQVGLFPEEDLNNGYIGEERITALDKTAKLTSETKPYRIIISRHCEMKNGIVGGYQNEALIEKEIEYFRKRLLVWNKVNINFWWQGQKKNNSFPVIEYNYELVVQNKER